MASILASSGRTSRATALNHFNIYLFRNDLRLHDNPGLTNALAASKKEGSLLVPLYCFDSRFIGSGAQSRLSQAHKSSPARAQFVIECVQDLRQRLPQSLVVGHGKTEAVIEKLVDKIAPKGKVTVFTQREVTSEELEVDCAIRQLHSVDELKTVWGSTLYEVDDLPVEVGQFPNVFTPFRNLVEKKSEIRAPLPVPGEEDLREFTLKTEDISDLDDSFGIPTLKSLGYEDVEVSESSRHPQSALPDLPGGETAGLQRVETYLFTEDRLKSYFETRNGLVGTAYSTKFAPWLSTGCLSPRFIASECRRYESERIANKSTYWVVFELMVRDFCRFFALKHGTKIFFRDGITDGGGEGRKWDLNEAQFKLWREGLTGYPFVDANMRELRETGFMSNRGRQNVASFLALDMRMDWRYGAEYFESTLIDHDVCSNWVSWAMAAGVTGGRINKFNTVKQSMDYKAADFIRMWVPELANVPNEYIHEPWKMSKQQLIDYKCANYAGRCLQTRSFDRGDGGKKFDKKNKNKYKGGSYKMRH